MTRLAAIVALVSAMLFSAPVPFAEAAASHEVRALLPTNLSSAELAEIDQDILRRALFSARMNNALQVEGLKNAIAKIIAGETDYASIREQLQALADSVDYIAPSPDEEGTITDLRSQQRIDLMLETNVSQALGFGRYAQGQDPAILDQWPAQELYRAEGRNVPRDWPARWSEAGGQFYGDDQRMLALKDADIWTAISRFGTPYPPFDFNSGMDVRDVDRDTAMGLGLIDRDTQIKPAELPDFGQTASASGAQLSDDLRAELEREGYVFDDDGTLIRTANVGTSAGAVKGWVTRRQGRAAIVAAVRLATTTNADHPPAVYSRVDSAQAAAISAGAGVDVAGYAHAVDSSSIRHILRQHGDQVSEARRGQIAVTQQDFERLPHLVAKAQRIEPGTMTPQGLATIKYTHVGRETTTVVEEIRTGRGLLVPKTIYKLPTKP